ncbi:uncharacterized protein METZ01_LOCUS14008 [marine metagenome]|uniref:Uncharacterized protein n=1 Tax=marine metagenome TaxID=408172 RepID=A0A381P3M6_9ZZZZ
MLEIRAYGFERRYVRQLENVAVKERGIVPDSFGRL